MNNNKSGSMDRIILILIIASLIICGIPAGILSFTIYSNKATKDVMFEVQNQNYTTNQTMNFSYIAVDQYNITFNQTTFEIVSPNDIFISIDYIAENISTITTPDTHVVSYYANTSGGDVTFNLSGFAPTGNYSIRRDNVEYSSQVADANGTIRFSNNVWSEHIFDIYVSSLAIEISCVYPNATVTYRPPVNLSAYITNCDEIYFYYLNMTPVVHTWSLVYNWTGGSGKYNFTNFSRLGNSFIWGNTTYNWSINVTDGLSWTNKSYSYTTTVLVSGKNARCDVDNNNAINALDLSADWTHRTISGYAPYDGLFDVNNDNEVNVIDLSLIWANRT